MRGRRGRIKGVLDEEMMRSRLLRHADRREGLGNVRVNVRMIVLSFAMNARPIHSHHSSFMPFLLSQHLPNSTLAQTRLDEHAHNPILVLPEPSAPTHSPYYSPPPPHTPAVAHPASARPHSQKHSPAPRPHYSPAAQACARHSAQRA